jgi:hypothetical protein
VALRTFNHQINALRYSVLHACTSTSKLDSRLGPEHTVYTLRARGTPCAGVQILFCACRSFRRAVVLVTSHRLNCPAISSSSIPNRSPVFQKLDEHTGLLVCELSSHSRNLRKRWFPAHGKPHQWLSGSSIVCNVTKSSVTAK